MTVRLAWRGREPPLSPTAVVARGTAASALARSLAARTDDALARLRACAGSRILLVLGEPADLPWADGAWYLGKDERAPGLLLPTVEQPELPPALLERALLSRHPDAALPLAVLPAQQLILPAGSAARIDRAFLELWLSQP